MNLFKIDDIKDYCTKSVSHNNPKTLKIVEGTMRIVSDEPKYRLKAITFPLTFMIQWQGEDLDKETFEHYVQMLLDCDHTKGKLEDFTTGPRL